MRIFPSGTRDARNGSYMTVPSILLDAGIQTFNFFPRTLQYLGEVFSIVEQNTRDVVDAIEVAGVRYQGFQIVVTQWFHCPAHINQLIEHSGPRATGFRRRQRLGLRLDIRRYKTSGTFSL
jgi:hypothetical protein